METINFVIDNIFCEQVEVYKKHLCGAIEKDILLSLKAIKDDIILFKLGTANAFDHTDVSWASVDDILDSDVYDLFCTRKLVGIYSHSLELSLNNNDELNPLTICKYNIYIKHLQSRDQTNRSNLVFQEMFFYYLDLLVIDYCFTNLHETHPELVISNRTSVSFFDLVSFVTKHFIHNMQCLVARRARRVESQHKHRTQLLWKKLSKCVN
jgi:hypothetical protein